jgi:RNA polymerase sigma factor (sigma-70 family)
VAKFRISFLGELARQMGFSPREARFAQIQAAEQLLESLEPNKAYPHEWIIHRLTGYRPKVYTEDLFPGQAIQHDLGLLIEQVSETLDIRTSQSDEPVLTIDDVSARFSVTSKTIQRWRRRGLPARRFIFGDGKRRVGFLLGSVERFFSEHKDQVTRGMNFAPIESEEQETVVRHARRLAGPCRCSVEEVCRRTAQALNRSPLTIQHVLRRYDQENPGIAVLASAAPAMSDEQRTHVLRGYRRGESLGVLARRVGYPVAAIYRAVIEERIARLNRRKIKFIDDPLYHQADALEQVEAIISAARAALQSDNSRGEENRVPRDLPAYLQELYRTPLLTPALERALYLGFHLHKYQFVQARRKLEPQFARARDIEVLEAHLRRATEVKNQIVRANLRLVVSIARKHLRPGLNLMELISDGNLTLMRAVESFDIHKGNRFSTYATLALMKGFARSVPQMLAGRRGTGNDPALLAEVADVSQPSMADRFAARDEVRRLLGQLNDREQTVVRAQFGLEGSAVAREQLTEQLGVTPQQLRQIEKTAIAKLRSAMGEAV